MSAGVIPLISVAVVQVQDSGTRGLAILCGSYAPAVEHVAQGAWVDILLQLLKSKGCSNAALGNISLCIGDLARQPVLLQALQQKDAVAPLLGKALHV